MGATDETCEFRLAGSRQDKRLDRAIPLTTHLCSATAHTFAFEFDLVMDVMAIFSKKQAEVSTGEKTFDTTVYKVWKHVASLKHVMKL